MPTQNPRHQHSMFIIPHFFTLNLYQSQTRLRRGSQRLSLFVLMPSAGRTTCQLHLPITWFNLISNKFLWSKSCLDSGSSCSAHGHVSCWKCSDNALTSLQRFPSFFGGKILQINKTLA